MRKFLVIVMAVVFVAVVAQAQVYTYDGSQAIYGPLDDFDSLDGTWDHNNNSDEWDGTGPGTGNPGGVMALTEGADTFLRLQDTGDPRDYSFPDPGSNRKSRFGHKLNSMTVLDDGCTLEFRARIATTLPLDDMHPDGGAGIVPWPAGGQGYWLFNGGSGTVGIMQGSGGIISFSLVTAADMEGLAETGGLIMNNLDGTEISANVDTGDDGTLNLLPLDDPTVWHAFKIDIAPGGTGTHVVDVYVDGAVDPVSFDVTIGNGGIVNYAGLFSYLSLGLTVTGASGSIDIDYVTFIPNMTVDAGDYQSILWQDPAVAQLDATVNDGGPSLTFMWSKLSGPGGVSFDPCETVEDPIATFDAMGTYELQCLASDGEKDACDVVTILVRANDDPVAHWTFENGTDTNVVDRTVNNNFGTFAGDPEPNWVDGWIGDWSLEVVDGSYVAITVDPTVDPNLDTMYGAVTVSAWVKVDAWMSSSWDGIVTKGDGNAGGAGGWSLIRYDDNDSLTFFAPDAGRVDGSVNVRDGYWHHVAGVHNGATISLYVDGLPDGSAAASGPVNPNTAELWINGNSEAADRFFDGEIDDVRIFNYGLNDAQVADLAAMGALIPIVDAGEDQVFSMQGGFVQLDATVTDDGKPEAAMLEWTSDPCNPGTVDFSNTAIEDPCVTFSAAGEYVLRLTVNDGMAGLEGDIYDDVTITVEDPTCLDVANDGLLFSADLSGPEGVPDCYIDLHDFAALAGSWLRCNNPQDPECEFPY